jgi:hypothetical protein
MSASADFDDVKAWGVAMVISRYSGTQSAAVRAHSRSNI